MGICLHALVLLLTAVSCSNSDAPGNDHHGMSVVVSILPQKYFIEKIAGDTIDVFVVVPPGANPASYEPTPSDMMRFSEAHIWFTIGVGFERAWIPRFSGVSGDITICSTIEDIERLPVDRYGIPDHEPTPDAEDHDHVHGTDDPHVWLSPELVRKQAEAIALGLSDIYPSDSSRYMENLAIFVSEIDLLQDSITYLLRGHEGESFIVFHPAWGYFADEFNLIQIPIEIAGSEPSPGELARLVDIAREWDIGAVFVSPQFSTSPARTIASEIEAEVLYLDPLDENWTENLLSAAKVLSEVMGAE